MWSLTLNHCSYERTPQFPIEIQSDLCPASLNNFNYKFRMYWKRRLYVATARTQSHCRHRIQPEPRRSHCVALDAAPACVACWATLTGTDRDAAVCIVIRAVTYRLWTPKPYLLWSWAFNVFTVTYLALLSAAVCWSYGRADGRRDAASVASYLRF